MDWVKQRVWQLGIGILLVFAGVIIIYPAASDPSGGEIRVWIGLALVFSGLAIPLISKIWNSFQEAEGEEGES